MTIIIPLKEIEKVIRGLVTNYHNCALKTGKEVKNGKRGQMCDVCEDAVKVALNQIIAAEQLDIKMLDISTPECVEILVRKDKKVIWINVDGICTFRASRIKQLKQNVA